MNATTLIAIDETGKPQMFPLYGFWTVHLALAVKSACVGWINPMRNWIATR